MNNLFDRDYQLTINVDGRGIQVKPPFKIAFSCTESIKDEINKMTIEIYGLNRESRISLTKDDDEKKYIGVELMIGYKNNLALLFKGSVDSGFSDRTGADFVTRLNCSDGGQDIVWSYTSAVVNGKNEAIEQCLSDMNNVEKGAITKINELIRPKVLVGNSSRLIRQMIGQNQDFFVCKEKAYILNDDEYRKTTAPVISSATGMNSIPRYAKKEVKLTTMMNPKIELGGIVKIESIHNEKLNGLYKVIAIATSGESHGDSWHQSLTCTSAENFKEVE